MNFPVNDQLYQMQGELKNYFNYHWPTRAGQIAVRFINGNFRAQGWQGQSFNKWKPNRRNRTILIDKGNLRRATGFSTAMGMVTIYNNTPYARIHNEGFNGTVPIKAHMRRSLANKRVATGLFTPKGKQRMKSVTIEKSRFNVKSHSRKVNIPKRQFMPSTATDSPVLINALQREIERELKRIFG